MARILYRGLFLRNGFPRGHFLWQGLLTGGIPYCRDSLLYARDFLQEDTSYGRNFLLGGGAFSLSEIPYGGAFPTIGDS